MLPHTLQKLNGAVLTRLKNTRVRQRFALSTITSPPSPNAIASLASNSSPRSYNTFQPSWQNKESQLPGSRAFADSELNAISDLFYQFAKDDGGGEDSEGTYLDFNGIKRLLESIGERPNDEMLHKLIREADSNGDGKLHLSEFLLASDTVLGGAPARIVLVVGGPGSGKGILCDRLAADCGAVHLSCGELLRDEVEQGTPLGQEIQTIVRRGGLVSSATITALVRRRMRNYPGKRVLLDGFPRSLENALDFAKICGTPELALNLYCDDTILMERILERARPGDDIHTVLQRLRTFHKSQKPTLQWLKDNHVPVINLDCSGTKESVWEQLLAIGRLMRPAAQLKDVPSVDDGVVSSGLFQDTPNNDDISSPSHRAA